MLNEADTCTRYIVPRLREAGWDSGVHSFNEQQHVQFTDGRIVMAGMRIRRKPPKRADYLLKYTRDFTIAVVEAKAEDCAAGEGLQQAKEYAEMLGLKFAYATNGHSIIEFDYLSGAESAASNKPDADPFDLLCHIAFDAPPRRNEGAKGGWHAIIPPE